MKDNKFDETIEEMKKMTGDSSIRKIDANDSFGFECKQCGQCCMHRNDIILNPFDVYNASKYLGITTEEFLLKYTYCTLGSNSKIPMVLLKSEKNGFCPFLKLDVKGGGKFKCTIHDAKPGACANHPIGVARGKKLDTGEEETQYVICGQCKNSVSDKMQVVKDWVKKYNDNKIEIGIAHEIQTKIVEYFDPKEFYKAAQIVHLYEQYLKEKSELFTELDDDDNKTLETAELGTKAFNVYVTNTISLGYIEYDINQPFAPQAEKNLKELSEFYENTIEVFNKMKTFADLINEEAEKYFDLEDTEEGEDENVSE
jgi:Fe-S-cluster containining protein